MNRSFGRGIRNGVRHWFALAAPSAMRSRNSLRAEVDGHIEQRVRYLMDRGVSPDAARADAIARFGGDLEGALQTLESSAVSSERQRTWMDRLDAVASDVRFTLRGLARAPVFTVGLVVTLALGLGINTAVFGVADRVLTRPPSGVLDAQRLRRVSVMQAFGKSTPAPSLTMSYPLAAAIVKSGAFSRVGLYASARALPSADGRDIAAVYVDSGFFAVLGARPAVGRFFDAAESEPGSNLAVAVVSFEYWTREMGRTALSDASPIRAGTRTYRVIGVASEGFVGIDLDPVDLWLPFGVAELGRANVNGVDIPWYRVTMLRAIRIIGRIPTGVGDERVTAQAGAAASSSDGSMTAPARGVQLGSIHGSIEPSGGGGDASRVLLARLIGVAIVVLVIACANAANLLLARGLRRKRELAVRLALGASRRRIVSMLMLESVLLGLCGGAAAVMTGFWVGGGLRRLVFPNARWTASALDSRVFLFTVVVAALTGLVAGLIPALQLTSPDLVTGLKDNRHQPGRRSHRTRATLIVLQTAFSLLLMIASGLLVRSLQHLSAIDLGFEPSGLVTVEVPSNRFNLFGTGSAPRIEAAALADRLKGDPAIKAIALSSNAPFGAHASMSISVPGRAEPDIPNGDGPWYSSVSPGYFEALGVRLLRGRLLTAADVDGSQAVAIVNETMARYYWRDAEPFSGCILARGRCARVVGVVRDVRDFHTGDAPPPRYYFPLAQGEDSAGAVVVRVAGVDAPRAARTVKSIMPSGQRFITTFVEDRVDAAMRPWRVAAFLFATLGAIALALSCVGVYSVMSYIASERIPELGVRMVLGATGQELVLLVLRGGLHLIVTGVVLGLIGAAAGARLLSALLFGVSPFDPLVYGSAALALCIVGIIASLGPALRVLRTEPTVALRAE